ncbi:Arf-GAP with coiled-coil, ANK repeat and PH domain-containing protein 2 [Apophysomyces sp. BC1034]|nr:Arf-GAP with coiled-coil, ANK repeat and PH domain-containing protein 2 [Apophysomyces sp. BC1034]
MPALDLRGCLEDSPKFRKRVNDHEESIQNFESSLKTLIKLSRAQVELSTEYSQRQQDLAQEFMTFSHSQDDPIVAKNSHVVDTFIDPLESFIKETLFPVKDLKKRFERSSDDVDTVLARYMGKRPRDPTLADSAKELGDSRRGFHLTYMDYVTKLNEIEAKKKVDYMENVLAYMYTESVFHHQSYEILKDLEPYMRDLTGLLYDTRQRYVEEAAEGHIYQDLCAKSTASQYDPTQNNYLRIPNSKESAPASKAESYTSKAGYLFERKGGRVLQSWTRKYFSIEGEELVCAARNPRPGREEDQSLAYNLRVCSVKLCDGYDRRFTFEVISPMRVPSNDYTLSVLVLQAETEEEMHEWVDSLKSASQQALNSNKSPPQQSHHKGRPDISSVVEIKEPHGASSENNRLLLRALRETPGNDRCADCQVEEPEWASTNLGVIMCIECSGIHRSLGVHVSKIRSLVLDKWETEAIEVMLRIGNTKANRVFEENVPADMESFRIHPNSSRPERDLWITEKYLKRSFVADKNNEEKESIDRSFWDAVTQSELAESLRHLARGAKIDYKNPDECFQTALHKVVQQGDEIIVEFLLQWFSDVNQTDENGWTSLHYAATANNVRLVLALLKRHAKADLRDKENKTPLDLAVDRQNVQAVTALRLFAFDKQHNASPASSLDFGFREAMSSFKQDRNSLGAHSHSAVDLRETPENAVLHDDQNSKLLHPK